MGIKIGRPMTRWRECSAGEAGMQDEARRIYRGLAFEAAAPTP
jgi:hypothetical protein